MFDGTFEMATITRTGSDGLARVIVRHSWSDRESLVRKRRGPDSQSAGAAMKEDGYSRTSTARDCGKQVGVA